MRTVITTILLFLTLSTGIPAHASEEGREITLSAAHHNWMEYTSVREVKESGLLFSLGYVGQQKQDRRTTFIPQAEFFGGAVDYQGRTLTGAPADTTVNYYGISFIGDWGLPYDPMPKLRLEPFAGIGVRAWLRDLQDGTTLTGVPVSGYTEAWTTLQARLGARVIVTVATATEAFFVGGIKLPVFTRTMVRLAEEEGGTIWMRPGIRSSLFGELGVRKERLSASLYYDSLKFPASDVVSGIFQPTSKMTLYGLKIGWKF